MKISYHWLQEYFEGKLPEPYAISELLTFGAYEVESAVESGDDFVFDIDVLPNRAHDSLCHRGIAKEISSLSGIPLAKDPLKEPIELLPTSLAVEHVVDVDRCRRYSTALIKGVTVGPSPHFLIERLERIGQRSINNIVDATNYVMFNIGQPLHAFDMDKLEVRDDIYRIGVRCAREGEKIETLDGETYNLSEVVTLIVDGNSDTPIGIAGIKGGKNTEIEENASNIIIESANFNPVSTRRASKFLKLRTEASIRFENELSAAMPAYGLHDVVALICTIAGGTLVGYTDAYPEPQVPQVVGVSTTDANRLLGTSLSDKDIEKIFKRLGFSYEMREGQFQVTAPFERFDLTIKEDLIEEIGRVYGYDKIMPIVPPIVRKPIVNKHFYYTEIVRNILVRQGFSEIFTYTFTESGEIKVENPVASDKAFLRKNLHDGLEKSLDLNEKNATLLGLDDIKVFEIGTVFLEGQEYVSLGVASSAAKADVVLNSALNILFEELGGKVETVINDSVVEINFDELLEKLPEPDHYELFQIGKDVQYQTISPYPFALRDIAVWVPKKISSDEVLAVIKKEAGELLVRNSLFDEYARGDKISYAYHLVFQSSDKTLSEEEINTVMERIDTALNGYDNWKVR